MLFVLSGNPNMMRSMISSCCLMLQLVSLNRYKHHFINLSSGICTSLLHNHVNLRNFISKSYRPELPNLELRCD